MCNDTRSATITNVSNTCIYIVIINCQFLVHICRLDKNSDFGYRGRWSKSAAFNLLYS